MADAHVPAWVARLPRYALCVNGEMEIYDHGRFLKLDDLIAACPPQSQEIHEEDHPRMDKPGNPDVPLTATTLRDPSRRTRDAERLDAMVTAFETLQARGFYLHDAKGERLDAQGFQNVMVMAGNAVLSKMLAASPPPGEARGGKSFAKWNGVRLWCEMNPDKKAAIVTPRGTFTVTFALPTPAPARQEP
jgi:hypothetical protein